MVVYCISGTLPAPWEDFFPVDDQYPSITIVTRDEADGDVDDDDDGWLDIILDLDAICEDAARLAIADALGIDNPEEVVIEQVGVCQSLSKPN